MQNTRKLEEMSNFEETPQRGLPNKKDAVECVCLDCVFLCSEPTVV